MLNWLFDTLRQYPEIAIFLALALGFWVGQMKFGTFSLGVVTSTLLAGILIGQLGITISPHVKSVFFLMFLFAVGYAVGPQFFRGLKSDGLPQVLFAVILCVLCLLSTFFVAKAMGYHTGFAAGLLSGACTISAVLGVAGDTIGQLGISAEQKKAWVDAMPVAYAVTYIFGTAGSAWILAHARAEAAAGGSAGRVQEARGEHGRQRGGARGGLDLSACSWSAPTGSSTAGSSARPWRSSSGTSPNSGCSSCASQRGDEAVDAEPTTVLAKDMIVALVGRREAVLEVVQGHRRRGGRPDLLDITGADSRRGDDQQGARGEDRCASSPRPASGRELRGVYLRKLIRAGRKCRSRPGPRSTAATCCSSSGPKTDHRARREGASATPTGITEKTDMLFMGLGIVIGALVGAVSDPRRRGAVEPEHQRRRAHRRAGVRLAALGQRDLRPHSRARRCGCSTTSA